MSRYRTYTDNKGKVVVVSSYAGKNVRGVAKCHPSDTFNATKGVEIAQARCDMRIAEKRVKRAKEKYNEAVAAFNKASKDFDKAAEYVLHAEQLAVEACKALEACGNGIAD